MDHVAIMKKSWNMIPKIVSGEKSIESRWYKTKRLPWGKISPGDTVYFKNSGEPITAKAIVSKIFQFEIKDTAHAEKIIAKYGKNICLAEPDPNSWKSVPKYCILISLCGGKTIKPFFIDKKGFGMSTAWITVNSISKIKK